MQKTMRIAAGWTFGLAILSSACESSTGADFQQLATIDVDVAECALGQQFIIDPAQLQNEYFPIHPGRQWELEGKKGSDVTQLTITVLNGTQDVGGVTTRVVQERETVNGAEVEVSQNFFAENSHGAVCYFGEDVAIRLPDGTTSTEGSWRAGNVSPTDPNTVFHPGIIMPADPRLKMRYQMEGAPGIAEDEGRITGSGRVKVPAGVFNATLRVREFNPLDGDVGFKTFARGVGMIIDGDVELKSCAGC
jgi:hypothetical protein